MGAAGIEPENTVNPAGINIRIGSRLFHIADLHSLVRGI